MHDYSKLINGCKKFGLEINDSIIEKLDVYYEMLVETNKVMNLTAITEFDDVLIKHYLDSLSISTLSVLKDGIRVLDLGTGAGFPGIPLAIAFPNVSFVLMDSLNKRINFLQQVIDKLGLKNVTAIHGRAEEKAFDKVYRETFDIVTSRAVANINTLSEYCIPFVKKGGYFISYKSGDINEELSGLGNCLKILGGSEPDVLQLTLPETDIDRSFIKIKKGINTPKKYPRKAGTPSKEPLR